MVLVLHRDYQLAAGWNNAAGLATLEGTIPAGDTRRFYAPKTLGSYALGSRRPRMDGIDFFGGKPKVNWFYTIMTRVQLEYLNSTYCGSGWSGKVTVRTRTTGSSFANYNAIMHVPNPDEMGVDGQRQKIWRGVIIRFTGLTAI